MFRNKFAEMKDSEARFDGSGYISVDPTNFYTEGQTSSISLRKPSKCFFFYYLLKTLLHKFTCLVNIQTAIQWIIITKMWYSQQENRNTLYLCVLVELVFGALQDF